ncbi:Ornithine decarboxylase [Penicillium expansum]|nr:Ornithine decarboxylase [Penicillium expansum]
MIEPQTIKGAIERQIQQNNAQKTSHLSEASFFVADLSEVITKYNLWQKTLPGVTPFFEANIQPQTAVKSNNDRRLLQTLSQCGAGFDCASAEEIELVLSLGVPAKRIIYTHPCKPISSIEFCRRASIELITFDNVEELQKMKDHYPEARLMLRVFADDHTGVDPLGSKFGVATQDAPSLLTTIKALQLNFEGVSFHAAPTNADPAGYVRAIQDAAKVFKDARGLGLQPNTLDIGGGYTDETFPHIAAEAKRTLDECFGNGSIIPRPQLIAEPGTLLSCSSFHLAVQVIARRTNATGFGGEAPTRLYINDGIYSNFMMRFIVTSSFVPVAVIRDGKWHDENAQGTLECSVWGRSCDQNDCINSRCMFSQEVRTGDWLVFKDMGAYTTVCSTTFNGFTSPNHVIYLDAPLN